jgi:phosphate transport system substrate-binding protein
VEGGGTASGFSALIQNDANICSASRPITPEEASRIATKYNSVGIYTTIAKDALSIYVNSDNSIKDFSMKQLGLIFGGEIKNWQELGGMDTSVLLIVRQPNSGTNLYFKEHILDGQEYGLNSHTVATNREVVNVVQQNIKAIGYGGITAGPDEMRASVDGIRASIDNVRYDLYPISRYLYLYTIKKPRGNIRKFMDWVVSREGQKIVEESGFISLWSFE